MISKQKKPQSQSLREAPQQPQNQINHLSQRDSLNTFQTKSLQKDIESLKNTNKELKSYFETELESYKFLADQLNRDNKVLKKYEHLYNESHNKNNKLIEKLLEYDKNKRFDDYELNLNFKKEENIKIFSEKEVLKSNGMKDREVSEFKNKLQKKKEDLRYLKNEIIPNYEKTLNLKDDEIEILKKKKEKLEGLLKKKKGQKLFNKKVEKVETIVEVEKFHIPGNTHRTTTEIVKSTYPIKRYISTRNIQRPTILKKKPIKYISSIRQIPRKVIRTVNNNDLKRCIKNEKNGKCQDTCPCLKKLLESHYKNCFCSKQENCEKIPEKNNSNLKKNDLKKKLGNFTEIKNIRNFTEIKNRRNSEIQNKKNSTEFKNSGNMIRSHSLRNIPKFSSNKRRSSSKRKLRVNLDNGGAEIFEDGKMVKSDYFDFNYAKNFETLGDFYNKDFK